MLFRQLFDPETSTYAYSIDDVHGIPEPAYLEKDYGSGTCQ